MQETRRAALSSAKPFSIGRMTVGRCNYIVVNKLHVSIFILILGFAGIASWYVVSREPSRGSEPALIVIPKEEKSIDILFLGDMMFDRGIRQVGVKKGGDFLFSCVDPWLKEADLVVGNLEGPITENASVSVGSVVGSSRNFQFTFPTSTAPLLFAHNVRLVNLGNNHINNFGSSGIASTKEYLTGAGVSYFGGLAGDSPVYRTTMHGINLSFVNYNQFGGDSARDVAALIATEHATGNTVIVYTHWGEEYVPPTEGVREIARLFAESGADLIVGSHPHVIQESESIGGTKVYYSLGNFIFDQYFDPEVRRGLTILVHIFPDHMNIEERPVTITPDGQTCPQS